MAMGKKLFSSLLAACLTLLLVPVGALAEEGGAALTSATTTPVKDITLGYSALHNGDTTNGKWDYVYFGTYGGNPIKWRVLSTEGSSTTTGSGAIDKATYKTASDVPYDGNALFMLSEKPLINETMFGTNYEYQGSVLQAAMKGILSPGSKELMCVLKTTKTDSAESVSLPDAEGGISSSDSYGASKLDEDMLFALSAREVAQYLGAYCSVHEGDSGISWWLRSPCSSYEWSTSYAGIVSQDGMVAINLVAELSSVRPTLNLNLASVLFTSAAVGGKPSDAAGGELTKNKNYASSADNDGYKLTMLDESRSAFSAELKSISGSVATISYSGATTGSSEYISAIVKNDDAVRYYGRVAAVSEASAASGEADITLPSDFDTANGDVLCVFNEQYNGDKNTDYASGLVDVLFDYTVNFDANGGEGTMAAQALTSGIAASLSTNTFTKANHTFTSWNTKADGTGTTYSDGQLVTSLASSASASPVTLYAQWADNASPAIGIDGADEVSRTQDYVFSVVLPEGLSGAEYGYDFVGKGVGPLSLSDEDGVLCGIVPASEYGEADGFTVTVTARTQDGFEASVTKDVRVVDESAEPSTDEKPLPKADDADGSEGSAVVKTGDNSNVALWVTLLLASATVVTVGIVCALRRKANSRRR